MARKAAPAPEKPADPRARIVDALMALAAEMPFEDITLTEIATRADVSLADFRDAFLSKGAVLGGFSRRIDRIVLDGTGSDLADESAKDRLFDVLMRRIDAMTPFKAGLESVVAWARRDALALSALNQLTLNSMRFMLEAAGIASDGGVGALKLQGLALAWVRILDVWFRDEDKGLAATMAALDKALERGASLVARAEDFHRLTAPLRSLAEGLFAARRGMGGGGSRTRSRYPRDRGDEARGAAL